MDEVYADQSMWFADVEDRADDLLERDSLKQALARGIGQLPEREAMVLQLYFVEEMNLEEIGQTLDIGAARVCQIRSEEHTSELQSLMRISYAVFCLNKKTQLTLNKNHTTTRRKFYSKHE